VPWEGEAAAGEEGASPSAFPPLGYHDHQHSWEGLLHVRRFLSSRLFISGMLPVYSGNKAASFSYCFEEIHTGVTGI